MYIFIFLNLCLSGVLWGGIFLPDGLVMDAVFYLGGAFVLSCFIASIINFKKFSYKLRYDLFASGALLVWVSYWPPFFRVDSPLFQYYPLYFAFITAFFSLVFITKRENMDEDAIVFLQWLSDSGRFNPSVIMLAVMVSLGLPQQFMLFPITLTLLVIRFTLASCLNNE